MNRKNLQAITGLAVLLVSLASGQAAIVYDNSAPASYQGLQYTSANEVGDEITLGGTDRTLTEFRFEYFANLLTTGGETVRLRLYANTGADADPGPGVALSPGATPLLDITTAMGNGHQIGTLTGLGVIVPDSFTWSAQFLGLGAGESAGLKLYNPPTTGSSANDFWENSGATWSLSTFGVTPVANFGAQVTAVPEASTVILSLLGGLSLVGYQTIRRRSAK